MGRPGEGGVGRLAEYNARRDFGATPEPEGRVAPQAGGGLRFVVQKHAARRLHFDLRLEWDGVLLSWAVTKGPSTDPREKRLAVRTEDHPLAYAEFEGTIPRGSYGGGTMMLWDRGTWEPEGDADEALGAGKLKFTLRGERLRGGWALIRMRGREKRENWLLVKERDGAVMAGEEALAAPLTSVKTGRDMAEIARTTAAAPKRRARPRFRPPQLATLVDTPPEGEDWLHETKFDGYRALAAVGAAAARAGDDAGVSIYTRSGRDWTDRFAPLVPSFAALPCASALIDGEVMAARVTGGSAFSALQAALSEGGALVFFAFDLLELDGRDLAALPLCERKAALAALLARLPGSGAIRMADHVRGHGAEVFRQACARGAEGIVSKRIGAPHAGRRTKDWRKVKCGRRQEFVIGGFRPSDRPGRPFASLLLGTWEGDRLVYRGRVGTGFTDRDLAALGAAFRRRDAPAFDRLPPNVAREACFVEPDLVAEVSFAEFTAEGLVRHAAFLGLRGDKPARAVIREREEMTMAEATETVLGITVTNPGRRVFPDAGCTKLDIARHYARVGERMIALAGHRPLSLYRCPGGLAEPCFFQKHGHGAMPGALATVPITGKDGSRETCLHAPRPEALVAAAQMGAVEFHIWGARIDRLDRPDRLVFDLDPDEGLPWPKVRDAAFELRDALAGLGLASGAIVTGGKGVHVWLPLRRSREWEVVKLFAKTFAHAMAEAAPDRFTATMAKARRKGRIFIDWLRNERGATAIAPYALRARKGAPVAVPVTWDELRRLPGANAFGIADMTARLRKPCPAAALLEAPQSLTGAAIAGLGGLSAGSGK